MRKQGSGFRVQGSGKMMKDKKISLRWVKNLSMKVGKIEIESDGSVIGSTISFNGKETNYIKRIIVDIDAEKNFVDIKIEVNPYLYEKFKE